MANDMKSLDRGYGIWFMSSGDEHIQMQQLIDELSQFAGSRRFDAHATLIGLPDFTPNNKEWLMKGAEALAYSSPPIIAELTGAGMRSPPFQSVFLHVVPTKHLVELNEAARRLFGHQTDTPFLPHVSMVYGNFDLQFKQQVLQRITTKISFPHTLTFDRLALIRADGYPDEWVIENEFAFRQ